MFILGTINNFETLNVQQTGYSFSFLFPTKKNKEKVAKPVFNQIFL